MGSRSQIMLSLAIRSPTDGDSTEESAVDPAAVIACLLLEVDGAIALVRNRPEPLGRPHHRDGGLAPVRLVKGDLGGEIDVGDVVTIGQRKKGVIRDIRQRPFRLAAGLSVIAGIDQRDPPGLGG